MFDYVKAFILVGVVGQFFTGPLYLTLLMFLGKPIPTDRGPGLVGAYVLFSAVVAVILWVARKGMPDGETASGRKAYRGIGIALFVIFGFLGFYP
ncbi:MAG: hypothetical protein HYY46_23385 [Deltaproteobacteria bacterium]|nr:hypothetical protein [Deltaproteobacteria bacterium]